MAADPIPLPPAASGVPAAIGKWATAALVLTAAWSVNRSYAPLFPEPLGSKIQLADLAFVVAAAFSARKFVNTLSRIPVVLIAAASAFVVLAFISALQSRYLGVGLVDSIGSAYSLAIAALVAAHARDSDTRELLLRAMTASVALVAAFAVIGLAEGWLTGSTSFLVKKYDHFPYLGSFYRPYSLTGNPKLIATYFGLYLPIVWFTWCTDPSVRIRRIALGATVLSILVLPTTASRGMGAIAISAYLTWRLLGKSRRSGQVLRAVLYAGIVYTVGFVILGQWLIVRPELRVVPAPWDAEVERVSNTGTLRVAFPESDGQARRLELGATVARTAYAVLRSASIGMTKEHPLLGIGPGAFRQEVRRRTDAGLLPDGLIALDPHNTVLGCTAERGLLGLVTFLAFWAAFLIVVLRAARGAPRGRQATVALLALAGIASIWLEGVLSLDIARLRPLWVLTGLGLAAVAGPHQSSPDRS